MKTINKITLVILSCFTLINTPIYCDEAADILVPTATGAALGGTIAGGRGAAYGALGGLVFGSAIAGSRRRYRDDRYYDGYYDDDGYYYDGDGYYDDDGGNYYRRGYSRRYSKPSSRAPQKRNPRLERQQNRGRKN